MNFLFLQSIQAFLFTCPPFCVFCLCYAADQTIRESLDLLKWDFAAYSADSLPRFLDPPVFDRTPAVEKGNMGSPVFDYTPLRQVLESETVEATPVMEETQSQSVAGTQIVTQDYMVEEQLAKEKERQAAKLAQHQEKLTTYYRKYPAKAKSAKGNAVVDDVPRDGEGAESTRDECAAETIPPNTTRKVLIDNVPKSSAKGYFSSPMGLTRRYGFDVYFPLLFL